MFQLARERDLDLDFHVDENGKCASAGLAPRGPQDRAARLAGPRGVWALLVSCALAAGLLTGLLSSGLRPLILLVLGQCG